MQAIAGRGGISGIATAKAAVRDLPLYLWLAADQQPQGDGAPYYLFDQSGQANHLEATGGGLTYVGAGGPGGQPAWQFDGASYAGAVRRVIPAGKPALTVSAVIRLASFVGVPEVIQFGVDHASAQASIQFALWTDGAMYCGAFGGEGNERYTGAGTVPATTWVLLTWVVAGAAFSGANPAFRLNGAALASARGTGALNPQIIPALVQVGANLQGPPAQILPNGSKLAELVVSGGAHATEIETYLMEKYDLL